MPQDLGHPSDANREYAQDKKTLKKQFVLLVTSNVADTLLARAEVDSGWGPHANDYWHHNSFHYISVTDDDYTYKYIVLLRGHNCTKFMGHLHKTHETNV